MKNHVTGALRLAAGLSLATAVHAQAPPNGSFESGDFTGWTVGLSARANVLQASDVANQIQPADGQYFALLSSGPGDVGGPTGDLDGNAVTDYDLVLLQTQLQFNTYPAYLQFDWTFPTDEEDQLPQYDDVFRVDVGGQAVFGRSSCKPDGGISPFPAALCGPFPGGDNPNANVGGGPPTAGTRLRFGIPEWRRFCQPIPGAVDGANDMTLTFRAGDQSDRQFDSALLLDNVRVVAQCEPPGHVTVEQRTWSTGKSLELKNGGLEFRPATMKQVVASADGGRAAFIAGMDFPAGANPALYEQVFIQDGAGQITRVTAFTGNDVHSIDLSPNGRWLAVAAREVEGAALNVFRVDLNNLVQAPLNVTGAAACDSHSPAINDAGNRIAFISECGGEIVPGFNPDGNPEFVFWTGGTTFLVQETSGCTSSAPAITMQTSTFFSCPERAVFVSSCNFNGQNPSGGNQIWRFQRSGGGFGSCTNNFSIDQVPQQSGHTPWGGLIDLSTNGNRIAYPVTDTDNRQVVIVQDWGGGNRARVGFGSAAPTVIAGFSMQRVGNPQSFAITRFIPTQLQFSLSLARVDDDQENEVLATSALLPAAAFSQTGGGSRQVFLISDRNLDSQETTEGYPQLFRAQTEPEGGFSKERSPWSAAVKRAREN